MGRGLGGKPRQERTQRVGWGNCCNSLAQGQAQALVGGGAFGEFGAWGRCTREGIVVVVVAGAREPGRVCR